MIWFSIPTSVGMTPPVVSSDLAMGVENAVIPVKTGIQAQVRLDNLAATSVIGSIVPLSVIPSRNLVLPV